MATDVRLLPQGTVIFEDISIEQFEGTVAKVIPKVPTKNQVCTKSTQKDTFIFSAWCQIVCFPFLPFFWVGVFHGHIQLEGNDGGKSQGTLPKKLILMPVLISCSHLRHYYGEMV